MKVMERIYKSVNGVIEKTRYYVGDRAKARGKRTKGNSNLRKQEQNFNSAVRRLARIFNCNFTHEGGMMITLDFNDEAICELAQRAEKRIGCEVGTKCRRCKQADECIAKRRDLIADEAEKEGKLFWRRLKRKLGSQIKVVLVTSDLNGDTKEDARIHCHIVLQAGEVSWDELKSLWKHGTVDIKQLRRQPDYSNLAAYLMRQVRYREDRKKYTCSRNMVMPVTQEHEIACMSEIRTPPGAQVFERRYADDESSQYVRYLPKKRTKKVGGHKLGLDGGQDDGAF